MKAARFMDVHRIEILEEPIPKPRSDEILLKVRASGVCGTDLHIYEGNLKGLAEPGTILGHEFAGIVEVKGENVKEFHIGDPVAVEPNLFCGKCHYCRTARKHFCENWKAIGLARDGGFAEYCVIPSQAAYSIPKGLSFETAAFFEPMACVLHGIERGRIKSGETVVIQGAGSIGQLFIQALKQMGADKIIVSEIDEEKLQIAKKNGAYVVVNVNDENLGDVVRAETDGRGAQVMVDTAGLSSTIPTALELLEYTGRVIIFGVPPEDEKVQFSPYEIYRREIEIIGSFTNPYTNEAALKMLKNINTQQILTNRIKLENLVDEGLRKIGKPGVLKIQVQYF
ncbi:MAG: zinc-dependent alcohol dehydrogenase family protein [Promethearchaeota archaeon]